VALSGYVTHDCLLSEIQDQILATCDAHGLEYVTDKTNFQPNLTPRNALRQELSQMASAVRQAEGTGSARENVSPKEPSSQTHSTAERVKQTLRRGYTAETRDLLQRALQQSELLEQQGMRSVGYFISFNQHLYKLSNTSRDGRRLRPYRRSRFLQTLSCHLLRSANV
jgi:tRNA(Ile)-lysidine synthase TilS/MesJ